MPGAINIIFEVKKYINNSDAPILRGKKRPFLAN
jgi:hypothetical protein